MTIAGKRLYIRLGIALVAIILAIVAAKMLFFPGKAGTLLNRGWAKCEAGDTAGAIDDYTAVLEMPEASAAPCRGSCVWARGPRAHARG